jgi:hypothetical protein
MSSDCNSNLNHSLVLAGGILVSLTFLTLFARAREVVRSPLRAIEAGSITLPAPAKLLAGCENQFVAARSDSASSQNMDPAKVAAAIKGNAQALRAFSWQQRMQLQLKGETKKVTLNQMTYDYSGNVQKTLLSEQPPPGESQQSSDGGRRGRLKEKIVEKKTGEFKDMMEGIASLVKSYTELPPEQLKADLQHANFSQGQGDMASSLQIQMANVIQNGDTLTIWIDDRALLFRKVAITTSYEQNPVTATANYAMLPGGQVYMAQAIVNYPAKQVVVQIDNSNYQKNG